MVVSLPNFNGQLWFLYIIDKFFLSSLFTYFFSFFIFFLFPLLVRLQDVSIFEQGVADNLELPNEEFHCRYRDSNSRFLGHRRAVSFCFPISSSW